MSYSDEFDDDAFSRPRDYRGWVSPSSERKRAELAKFWKELEERLEKRQPNN